MDTRQTPFGDHPDGGKISELKADEPIPNHMMPISPEAQKILDKIPMVSRVGFVLNSTIPELKEEKEYLLNRMKVESPKHFMEYEYSMCKKDFRYWVEKYFNVVHKRIEE